MSKKKSLRVKRTEEDAIKTYNRMSYFYNLFTIFEKKYIHMAIDQLDLRDDDCFLEIGFGTGTGLYKVATEYSAIEVYGIDISPKMLAITEKKLKRADALDRVHLYCKNALKMPFPKDYFDSVFMSFTLELFDTPEIPMLLKEIKRVLKPKGQLGIICLSKNEPISLMTNIYEWGHKVFPKLLDCRPIYINDILKKAGFVIEKEENVKIYSLPTKIVISKL